MIKKALKKVVHKNEKKSVKYFLSIKSTFTINFSKKLDDNSGKVT